MEVIDNKSSEATPSPSPQEGSGTSPKTKGDLLEKNAVENGSVNGSSEKKITPEKESVAKDETKNPAKQPEPTAKQSNVCVRLKPITYDNVLMSIYLYYVFIFRINPLKLATRSHLEKKNILAGKMSVVSIKS